jgi:hypothetical protein
MQDSYSELIELLLPEIIVVCYSEHIKGDKLTPSLLKGG